MWNVFLLLAIVARIYAQVPLYQQCGGINYSGNTNCVSGTTCQVINAWYYQCLPGSSSPPPPSPSSSSGSVVPQLAGNQNVMAAGTYPRATRLIDGSILSVHTSFSNGANIITAQKSTDNGVTWQNLGTVTQGVGDIDNPFVLQLASGRVLCAFRNHSKNSAGQYTWFRITVCYSDNMGQTWTYLSTPDQNGNPVTGLWEPFMRLANNGALQLYYSRENAANDQDSIMRTSTDGGQTWSGAMTISGAGITARDGMLGVAPFNDGTNKLIAVFETNENGPFSIKSVTSSDDGNTWGNRQLIYSAPGSYNANAPQVTNCGGTLVVTFMTNEDGQNGEATKLIVQTAIGPGSISWGNKITVGPVVSNWDGIMTLDNSNVLVMFDHGGCKSQTVTLNRS